VLNVTAYSQCDFLYTTLISSDGKLLLDLLNYSKYNAFISRDEELAHGIAFADLLGND